MARARLGGTKAKIRGKVGSDIYQLHRDSDGVLMQTVYEQNPNPKYSNSELQARNRMIMGQVERMWHWLPQIIKDAYVNVPRGTLSFQRFSRLNYPLLRSDYDNHFDGGSDFDWQTKYNLYAPAGPWQLTQGSLPAITWDDAVCSLNWNNGVQLTWDSRPSYATYGDFLDCFGLKHCDRMVLAIFRQEFAASWGYVETWSFWPREDYPSNMPWEDVDDEHPFITNCPYFVTASQGYRPQYFTFDIDTQDYERMIKIACFALFLVRQTDKGTLFSSSKFNWAQRDTIYGYRRHSPSEVWPSWNNQD